MEMSFSSRCSVKARLHFATGCITGWTKRSEYSCNKYVNRVEWGFLIGLIFVMPLDHIKPRVKINE